MSKKDRLARLRSARSLNDIVAVVSEISANLKTKKWISASADDELTVDFNDDHVGNLKIDPKAGDDKFVTRAPAIKLKVSDKRQIQSSVDKLHELYDNLAELENAYSLVEHNFKGMKKQQTTLKTIKALVDEVEVAVNDCLDNLSDTAQSHLPEELEKFTQTAEKALTATLQKGSYKKITSETFADVNRSAGSTNDLMFCHYITVEGLKDESGYVHRKYFFVLTAHPTKTGYKIFITSLPEFRPPNKYPEGKAVTNLADLKKRLMLLVEHNNFMTSSERVPLNVDQAGLKHAGVQSINGVADVTIDDDDIIVHMKGQISDALVEQTAVSVMARLNGVLKTLKNQLQIVYKPERTGRTTQIRFSVIPKAGVHRSDKPLNLTKIQLDSLVDVLNLDPVQRKALQFAIQHKMQS